MVTAFKFARKVVQQAPYKGIVATEYEPGVACQTDEQIRGVFFYLIVFG